MAFSFALEELKVLARGLKTPRPPRRTPRKSGGGLFVLK